MIYGSVCSGIEAASVAWHHGEDVDEPGPWVTLITETERARVILHGLSPRRAALGSEVHVVIV